MKKIDKSIVNTDTSNATNADIENIGKSSIILTRPLLTMKESL